MSLKVSHLYKSYDKPIIQDFSYTFEDNHIYAITGPSGCGKTTLLYLLGFLEKKDQGSILIDDKEPKSIQKLYKHTIGFLFQNYALIENETIEQNLKMILKKVFGHMLNVGDRYLSGNNDRLFKKMFDIQSFMVYTLTIKVKEACFERSKSE